MDISIGRIVHYVLSAEDAAAINRRRTTGASIAERMGGANPTWPTGAQAHVGNAAVEGQECPAMCVRVLHPESEPPDSANFRVFLDGSDVYWATARLEDTNMDKKLPPTPGTWHWTARDSLI